MHETEGDRIVIGAEPIAREIFGGALTGRQVYRLAARQDGWPFFKLCGKLAARPAAMHAEIRRRESQHRGV